VTLPSRPAAEPIQCAARAGALDRTLGEVRVSCARPSEALGSGEANLADLECSDALLRRALLQRVHEVGGNSVLGMDCGSRPLGGQPSEAGQGQSWRWCSGQAALRHPSSVSAPPCDEGEAPPSEYAPLEAWSVQASSRLEGSLGGAPRRGAQSVQWIAHPAPPWVGVGSLQSRCDACSRAAAEQGLAAMAGAVGALAVMESSCIPVGKGWSCQGTAATTELRAAAP